MTTRKSDSTREDLKNFKEEIIHQFHIISENTISQVKQVAEGVINVNEKLERFREEIKADVEIKFGTLSQAITGVNEKLDQTRQELKTDIQEVRQEFGEKLDQTRQELKTDIQEVRQEFGEKLDQTRQELKTDIQEVRQELYQTRQELKIEIQETRQEILAAIKFSYAELDKRLTSLEKDFLELKRRVEKIESRSIS